MLVAFSAVLWVAGAVVGAGLQAQLRRERAELQLLRDEGLLTEAQITRLWRGRGDERPPYVAYRFRTGAAWQDGARRVPLRLWRTLHEGDAFSVRYAPSRPELNHPALLEPRPMPLVVPLIAATVLALSGGLCWLPVVGQRRLLAEGRAARALVTGHAKQQHGTVLRYEFATLGGSLAKGKTGPQRKPQAIGSTLYVLYDPERPASNSPYPLSLVRPFWGALR